MIVARGVHGHAGHGMGGEPGTGGDSGRGHDVERNSCRGSDTSGVEHEAETFPG